MNIYPWLIVLFLCSTVEGCWNETSLRKNHDFMKSKVIIIKNNDPRWINMMHRTYHSVHTIPDICPGGVEGLIIATKLYPHKYIINLNVNDFYKFNQNYVFQHLVHGGELATSRHEVKACVVNTKNHAVNITCHQITSKTYPTVKLMSKSVENDIALRNFVWHYPVIPQPKILLCDKNNLDIETEILGFKIIKMENCEHDRIKKEKDVLAVIAPKAFDTDYNIIVPVVLYQTPCFERSTQFDNNIVMLTTCHNYEYAMLEFLKHSKWARVAIISDETEYSQKFEKIMTALFESHSFTYIVVRCQFDQNGCNFHQALQTLEDLDARVIIANVNEENAAKINECFNNISRERKDKTSWIFRDFTLPWKKYVNIYLLSLAPSISQTEANKYKHHKDIEYKRNPILHKNVITALLRIHHAYHKLMRENLEQGTQFYRRLTHKLQKMSEKADVIAYVSDESKNIQVEMIVNHNVTVVYTVHHPLRDMDECQLKSNNFNSPCNENNVLIIMVVLVVVAACVLLTVIYTNRFNPSRRQYTNFT